VVFRRRGRNRAHRQLLESRRKLGRYGNILTSQRSTGSYSLSE
jgi:hypothetical protein